MSFIHYAKATYATQLRDQLEIAGCDTRVAAILARAMGELIDHVTQAEDSMRRDLKDREWRTSLREREVQAAKPEWFDRVMGVTVFVLAVALVAGVLLALFR